MTMLARRKRSASPSPADLEAQRREEVEKAARENADRRRSKRRVIVRRTFGWAISLVIVAALVLAYLAFYEAAENQREQTRQQLANTEFSHELTSTDPLLLRVDGSYYSVTVSKTGVHEYEYSTLDANGAVVDTTVSTSMPDGKVLWRQLYRPIDVSVRLIDPAKGSQEPRIEFESCAASPIDASRPSYVDDVHSYVPTGSPPVDDHGPRLCVDRVTLWTPVGTLQP